MRVRRWYDLYRESVPPSQPSLRNKYYQKKLKNITSQMVRIDLPSLFHPLPPSYIRLTRVTRADILQTVCWLLLTQH